MRFLKDLLSLQPGSSLPMASPLDQDLGFNSTQIFPFLYSQPTLGGILVHFGLLSSPLHVYIYRWSHIFVKHPQIHFMVDSMFIVLARFCSSQTAHTMIYEALCFSPGLRLFFYYAVLCLHKKSPQFCCANNSD